MLRARQQRVGLLAGVQGGLQGFEQKLRILSFNLQVRNPQTQPHQLTTPLETHGPRRTPRDTTAAARLSTGWTPPTLARHPRIGDGSGRSDRSDRARGNRERGGCGCGVWETTLKLRRGNRDWASPSHQNPDAHLEPLSSLANVALTAGESSKLAGQAQLSRH